MYFQVLRIPIDKERLCQITHIPETVHYLRWRLEPLSFNFPPSRKSPDLIIVPSRLCHVKHIYIAQC